MPIVLPLTKPVVMRHCRIHVNTARCVSSAISRRVREIVEWSGGVWSRPTPKKLRSANESAAPRDAALGVNALEIADQQTGNRFPVALRPAHGLGIKPGALRFDEIIEAVFA